MKYLKLDPWRSECWGLARALYGSPVTFFGDLGSDYGVLTYVCEVGRGFQTSDLDMYFEPILIPFESIKLCPYVAMREGVLLKGKNENDYGFGQITKIHKGFTCNLFKIKDNFYADEITLDFDLLPKGAEVVEL